MLVALCCVWNEAELLPGLLDSLEGNVDRVVAADGRYKLYPGQGPAASSDGTLELLRERVDTVIEVPDTGWGTEHQKRTELLSACETGDMCLVIDADERLHARGAMLRRRFGDFRVQIHGPARFEVEAPRLFAFRPGLEYRWHFGLFTRHGRPVFHHAKARLPREIAWIEHRHDLRDPDRVRADGEYERDLIELERSLGAYGPPTG